MIAPSTPSPLLIGKVDGAMQRAVAGSLKRIVVG
jgi:hypothetical protein